MLETIAPDSPLSLALFIVTQASHLVESPLSSQNMDPENGHHDTFWAPGTVALEDCMLPPAHHRLLG